ncbi:MAG: M48 family metallopeptidase [Treponema sp.]|nr:M48 family metallopeptidase [Treponema sp.]
MFSVDFSSPFVIIFITGTFITFLINSFLEFLDYRSRVKHGTSVPEVLKDVPGTEVFFSPEKLAKIVSYENSKYFLWIPKSIVSVLLTLSLVVFGFYPLVFKWSCAITGYPHSFWSLFFCFLIFSVISGIPETIISLPFNLYREFSIEKRFGFSNMTFKLWITDEIKSTLVSIIPLLLLSLAVSFAFVFFENSWWLIVSIVLLVFVLLVQIIYPKFIAPLFNKFEPLPEGELKEKLENLLMKTGFKSDGLFVMDASKRSGHSNAYFSGFGKSKRIVLYDTLIQQMSADELVAVLGHELGHFKLKHILKGLLKTIPLIFIGAYLLFRFSQMESMYSAFGFELQQGTMKWVQFIGITLTTFVWQSVTELLSPLGNIASRKHEYQADKFSAEVCGTSKDLISGLVKLNSENLSELYPPAIYVWWNYSHPTLVQRVQALKQFENGK